MKSNQSEQQAPAFDGSGRLQQKEKHEDEFTIDEAFEDEFDKNQRIQRETNRKERYKGWKLWKTIPQGFFNYLVPSHKHPDYNGETISITRCKIQVWKNNTHGKVHEGRLKLTVKNLYFLEKGSTRNDMKQLLDLGGNSRPKDAFSTDENLSFQVPLKNLFSIQKTQQTSAESFKIIREKVDKADGIRIIFAHIPDSILLFGFPSRVNYEETYIGLQQAWMKVA